MAQTEQLHGLCHPFRFIKIVARGTSGLYGTKRAAPGTNVAQDHESGGVLLPAFTNIGTVGTFAHCVQLMSSHQPFQLMIILAAGKTDFEPSRVIVHICGLDASTFSSPEFNLCNPLFRSRSIRPPPIAVYHKGRATCSVRMPWQFTSAPDGIKIMGAE